MIINKRDLFLLSRHTFLSSNQLPELRNISNSEIIPSPTTQCTELLILIFPNLHYVHKR